MRILISNDDGYFAPGIEHLAQVLGARHDVTVVAPERDRSGASNSLTLDRPLMVRRAPNGFIFVNGTPTACVWRRELGYCVPLAPKTERLCERQSTRFLSPHAQTSQTSLHGVALLASWSNFALAEQEKAGSTQLPAEPAGT
jgi:hypothetical protein